MVIEIILLNDIDFLDDELRFFKKILKLHFSLPANAIRIEFVEKQLFRLELNKQMIRAEVINHREVLELLVKNLISLEEDNVRDQNRDLEQKLTELNILFKKFKSDFFHLTEDLMGIRTAVEINSRNLYYVHLYQEIQQSLA